MQTVFVEVKPIERREQVGGGRYGKLGVDLVVPRREVTRHTNL